MSLCPLDYSWGFCLNTPTLVRDRQYRAHVTESFLNGLIRAQQLIHPKSFWHLSAIQINNLHFTLAPHLHPKNHTNLGGWNLWRLSRPFSSTYDLFLRGYSYHVTPFHSHILREWWLVGSSCGGHMRGFPRFLFDDHLATNNDSE